jgi:hypothetical protein
MELLLLMQVEVEVGQVDLEHQPLLEQQVVQEQ